MKTITNRPPPGFTLVELLVVIAIIAILASLLGTSLARAKAGAQRIGCLNKLKQWGHASYFYAADNNDKLPQESVFDGINTWEMTTFSVCSEVWYNSLPRALGVTSAAAYSQTVSSQRAFYSPNNFFHCPTSKFAPVAATYPNFSLAINSKLMMDFEASPAQMAELVSTRELKFSQIIVPSKTALFLDSGVAGEETVSEFQPPYSGQPKAYASEFSGRHKRAGNILFADGRVATFKAEAVIDMDANSPRRGGGIFPPKDIIWRHDPSLVP